MILIVSALVFFYSLMRLYKGDVESHQRAQIFLSIAVISTVILIIYLALTGKLAWIIGLLVAWFPWARRAFAFQQFMKRAKAFRARHQQSDKTEGSKRAPHQNMSREEALTILGLGERADDKEIAEAYKRLMSRLHPDREGSDYLASLVNQARDVLLKNKSS